MTRKILTLFAVFLFVVAVYRAVNNAEQLRDVRTVLNLATNTFSDTVTPSIQRLKEYTTEFSVWETAYTAIEQPQGEGVGQVIEWVKYIGNLIWTTMTNLYHTLKGAVMVLYGSLTIFVKTIAAVIDFFVGLFGVPQLA